MAMRVAAARLVAEKVNLLLRRKSAHDVTRRAPTIQRSRIRTIYSPHGTCLLEIRAPVHSSTSCDVGGAPARARSMLNRDRPCDDEDRKPPAGVSRAEIIIANN